MEKHWINAALILLLSVTRFLLADGLACDVGEWQCGSGECITHSWKCDGEEDCVDNSDEASCTKKCPDTQFACKNGRRCIPKAWTCDGGNDCGDNSDESATDGPMCVVKCASTEFQCNVTKVCINSALKCDGRKDCGTNDDSDEIGCEPKCSSTAEFKCGDGKCIDSKFKCNRRAECADKSDEKDCNLQQCTSTQFKCIWSGHCIDKQARCDGNTDCVDGSDEQRCPATTPKATTTKQAVKQSTTPKKCYENHFQCTVSGKCVHNSWLCDGERDCDHGEDESKELCEKRTCSPRQFACKNGKCIQAHLKCDGLKDCDDNSDEENCPTLKPVKCSADSFKCGNSSVCVDQAVVCNAKNDCPGGEDEPTECGQNECQKGTHLCAQNCVDLKIGYKCTCNKGYHLALDNRTCVNINECHELGTCSQNCVDLKGSYKCLCIDGYKLDGDGRTCRASGELPQLVLAMLSEIRQIRSDGQHYKTVVHTSFLDSAMSLDVDIQGQYVYLTDLGNKSVARASLKNPGQFVHIVRNVEKPEGIAYDWISNKVYWTSTHPKYQGAIEVSNADGTSRSVLVFKKVDEPRAIAVHPAKRILFWTDWGAHPRIERVSMDGLQRQVVVTSEHLTWPNGVTVDYVSDRIYWSDSKRNYIGSCNLDGSGLVIVAKDIPNPYGVAVFEDSIYWTNYRRGQVFRANKFTGANKFEYQDGFFSPMDIQIIHPLLQKQVQNPCATNNGGCSHLCLLSAVKQEGYSCACPTDVKMFPDGKTCDVVYPTTNKILTTAQRKQSTSSTSEKASTNITTSQITRTTSIVSTLKLSTTVKPEITTKQRNISQGCHDHEYFCSKSKVCVSKTKLCNGVNDCPLGEDEQLDRCNSVEFAASQSKSKSDNTPLIAGIVAGIAFVILIIVVVVLIIFKRKRNKSNLSITFNQADPEKLAVHTVKFSPNGTHKKTANKNFENVNYTQASEREELIPDPGLMNIPDDSSSDAGSTCDETKPVIKHQESNSSGSLEC